MKAKQIIYFSIIAMGILSCKEEKSKYDASGSFEAVETIIASEAPGKILQFNIQEGQQLDSGQIIGFIDSTQLHLNKMQLLQNRKAILSGRPETDIQVESLKKVVNLKEDDVVLDIGSNDGTTLSFYPTNLTRLGMDPTAARFRDYYEPGIHVVADFFSAERFQREVEGRKAKIVTSIAMFYDLEQPIEFCREIASVLAPDGVWHFEQSYMPSMLRLNSYDTICHEHLEYYSLGVVQRILA